MSEQIEEKPEVVDPTTWLNENVEKLKGILDANKDGKIDKNDLKLFLFDLLSMLIYSIYLSWEILDGELILAFQNQDWAFLGGVFRAILVSMIIPFVKRKYITKVSEVGIKVTELEGELESMKIENQTLKNEVVEKEHEKKLELLKLENEMEKDKNSAILQTMADKQAVVKATE